MDKIRFTLKEERIREEVLRIPEWERAEHMEQTVPLVKLWRRIRWN